MIYDLFYISKCMKLNELRIEFRFGWKIIGNPIAYDKFDWVRI